MPVSTPATVWKRFARTDLREHEDKIMLLLALVISAVVGLTVVAFVAFTEHLGKALLTSGGVRRFLSPVLGSLAGGWLLFRFFPDARGSGIPQTRVALILEKGVIRLRTVVGKFICSSISLGSGIALGREGPSVHIGAGIASVTGRRLGLSDAQIQSLIPVGTAAAVAAAFNTPLAAVLFTLEEILDDLHARVIGSVVIGAATSWIILRLILGDEPLFHVPAYQLVNPLEFFIYALLGLLGGVLSTVFVKLLLWQRSLFLKVPVRWKPFTPVAGGLLVGLIALGAPGVLGVGYNLVGDALNGQMAIKAMMLLLVLKLVATSTCYSSGNAGGIFGPSLFMGAMLGGGVGHVAHSLFPDQTGNAGAYALVGMGAAFAGIVRTPMTSVIMIFEVTRDYTIVVPLMIANMCSYVLARKFQRQSVYEALSRQEGIAMPSAAHRPDPLTVDRAMRQPDLTQATARARPAGPPVHPDDPLDSALQLMGETGADEILVVGRAGGKIVGVLSTQDILAAYKRPADPAAPGSNGGAPVRNWLPTMAAITLAAVAITSGLVFWQRSRRSDEGIATYNRGARLMAQGKTDEAIPAFRDSLARTQTGTAQDRKSRAALGLALVESGDFTEAAGYLPEVARAAPENGPVWLGLGQIALARGDTKSAVQAFERALAGHWPPEEESKRRSAQLKYASLLSEAGRRDEGIGLLLTVVRQRGDDPATAGKAAAMVAGMGSPEQTEEAYAALASHFPADAGVWLKLGGERDAAGKDIAALEAYRGVLKAEPANPEALQAIARLEEILRLDPARRGLSARERATRWDEVLRRVTGTVAACGKSSEAEKAETEKAMPLLKARVVTIEDSVRKMTAAKNVWSNADPACRTDPVLSQVMQRIADSPAERK